MVKKGYVRTRMIRYFAWICSIILICCGGKVAYALSVSSNDVIAMRMMTVSGGDGATVSEGDSTISTEQINDATTEEESTEEAVLLLPTRLDFVIDPWEISGYGSLYSSVFTVQNVSEAAGWLNIEGIRVNSKEDAYVTILTDASGVRANNEKNVYMEMCCSDGSTLVMSEEGQSYRVWLEPGEKFEFEFIGKVNPHAELEWKVKDVTVHMLYSWERE